MSQDQLFKNSISQISGRSRVYEKKSSPSRNIKKYSLKKGKDKETETKEKRKGKDIKRKIDVTI